jgi:hypothetical protein
VRRVLGVEPGWGFRSGCPDQWVGRCGNLEERKPAVSDEGTVPEDDPSEVEPTDNSTGAAIDSERLEEIEHAHSDE